jgi:hypothetical protein
MPFRPPSAEVEEAIRLHGLLGNILAQGKTQQVWRKDIAAWPKLAVAETKR